MTQVHGTEAGQQIQVLSPLVIPQGGAFAAHEHAPVTERAEQPHERRVYVAFVVRHGGVARARAHANTLRKPSSAVKKVAVPAETMSSRYSGYDGNVCSQPGATAKAKLT